MSCKILVLEDNKLLLETLEEFLSDHGYIVKAVDRGVDALNASFAESFDLFLLDVKVPDMSGFEFLKSLRDAGNNTPAIFLTSLTDKESLTKGFNLGGDDYIKKPFDLDELLLRVRAIMERMCHKNKQVKIDENFTIDLDRKRLIKNGKELNLNLKDFQLLCLLVEDRGKVVTTDMIVDTLWKHDEANIGSIRVYVTNLKKIFGKDAISNIRGIGYRFEK
ncbi:response regulator transcription factor [Sulfurospirillum sp. 1612]|uniref:response regulator transcription factor n=1 Tax=Sulfurospirillum sp. 1612 TaxID=3094835 RepID=UPI002F92E460